MQLEELIATLIAALNTNTSSLDENNRLLRAAGASSPPAEPAPTKTRKTKAAPEPEPEPTPEPAAEPEPPTLDAPDEMDEPEDDTTDYLEETRQTVRKYRQANPEKAAANKAAYAEVIAKFGVTSLAEVPKEKSKDFYLAVQAIC